MGHLSVGICRLTFFSQSEILLVLGVISEFRQESEHWSLCSEPFGLCVFPLTLVQWGQKGAFSSLPGGVKSWIPTRSPLTPRGIPCCSGRGPTPLGLHGHIPGCEGCDCPLMPFTDAMAGQPHHWLGWGESLVIPLASPGTTQTVEGGPWGYSLHWGGHLGSHVISTDTTLGAWDLGGGV